MDGKEAIEKDLVWLPKELAAQVKDLDDKDLIERMILSYVNKSRKELKSQIECFDDDVLVFQGQLAKAKAAFKEAQEAHYGETYELWEQFNKDIVTTRQFVDTAVGVLTPLKAELEAIDKLMLSIQKWNIKEILDLLERVGAADEKSRGMLKFLFDNFNYAETSATAETMTDSTSGNARADIA